MLNVSVVQLEKAVPNFNVQYINATQKIFNRETHLNKSDQFYTEKSFPTKH